MFMNADEWASSEEGAGIDTVTLMRLATKCNRQISGFRDSNSIYGLLMAVYHCDYDDAERFIIKNKIKLTHDLKKSNDSMVSHMIEYLKEEKNYDIVGGKKIEM